MGRDHTQGIKRCFKFYISTTILSDAELQISFYMPEICHVRSFIVVLNVLSRYFQHFSLHSTSSYYFYKRNFFITCFVTHSLSLFDSLRHMTFLNRFKTNIDRQFKLRTLDLQTAEVVLTNDLRLSRSLFFLSSISITSLFKYEFYLLCFTVVFQLLHFFSFVSYEPFSFLYIFYCQ